MWNSLLLSYCVPHQHSGCLASPICTRRMDAIDPLLVSDLGQGSSFDASSTDITTKLRESQERQKHILVKIAEKEKKLEALISDTRDTGGNQTRAYESLGDSLADTLDMNSRKHGFDATVTESGSFAEDFRQMSVIRDQEGQLRFLKAEIQRKDMLTASLRQQVLDFTRSQSESLNQKAQFEIYEQQARLREDELAQHLEGFKQRVEQQLDTEQHLRQQLSEVQRDKLRQDQTYTISMGELEAKLAGVRAEVERREVLRNRMDYELSSTTKELRAERASHAQFKESQRALQLKIEDKVVELKQGTYILDQRVKEAGRDNGHLEQQNKDLKEALELKQLEYELVMRSKQTQDQLLQQSQQEAHSLQAQLSVCQQQASLVPDLQEEVKKLKDTQEQLRRSESELSKTRVQLSAEEQQRSTLQEENDRLHALTKELDSGLISIRTTFASVVGPKGELAATQSELHKMTTHFQHQTHILQNKEEELETERQQNNLLSAKLNAITDEASLALSTCQRMMEALVEGNNTSVEVPDVLEHTPLVRKHVDLLVAVLNQVCSKHKQAKKLCLAQSAEIMMLKENIARMDGEAIENLRLREELERDLSLTLEENRAMLSAKRFVQLSQEMFDEVLRKLGSLYTTLCPEQVWQHEKNVTHESDLSHLKTSLGDILNRTQMAARQLNSELRAAKTSYEASNKAQGEVQTLLRQSEQDKEHAALQHQDALRQLEEKIETMTRNHRDELEQVRETQRAVERDYITHYEKLERENRAVHQSLLDETNRNTQDLKQEHSRIKQELQKSQLQEQHTALVASTQQEKMEDLAHVITQLAASARLVFRGFRPLYQRHLDVLGQKLYLTQVTSQTGKLEHEIDSLLRAMTASDGKTTKRNRKVSFRGAVIAVLACNRIAYFRSWLTGYGVANRVGEKVLYICSPEDVTHDDNIPVIDISESSAVGLHRIMNHFDGNIEKPPEGTSLVVRLGNGFYRHQSRLMQTNLSKLKKESTLSKLTVIRRIALALATRVRDLETQHRTLQRELVRQKKELVREGKRSQSLMHSNSVGQETVQRLQEKLKELQAKIAELSDPASETIGLRKKLCAASDNLAKSNIAHEELKKRADDADGKVASIQALMEETKRTSEIKTRENDMMRIYIRRKGNELSLAERECQLKGEHAREVQSSLEELVTQHKALQVNMQEREAELQQTNFQIQRLQATVVELQAENQRIESIRVQLNGELEEKEHDLYTAQKLVQRMTREASFHAEASVHFGSGSSLHSNSNEFAGNNNAEVVHIGPEGDASRPRRELDEGDLPWTRT